MDAALILVLLKLLLFFILFTRRLSSSIGRGLAIALLLSSRTSHSRVRTCHARLRTSSFITNLGCVSGRRTLGRRVRFKNGSPSRFLNTGPCATSVRLHVGTGCTGSSDLTHVATKLGRRPLMSSIVCRGRLISTMGRGLHHVDCILLALTKLLILISLTLVNGAMGLDVCSKHFIVHAVGLINTK